MRKHRIYLEHDLQSGKQITLPSENKHYITTVLRLKNGDQVYAFNGDGKEYSGTLIISKKSASLELIEQSDEQSESKTQLHLLQGIARGDHMDFALQKATELGVNLITPVITARTQQHKHDRLQKRFQHWQNIIIHACEQSGRCYLPELKPIHSYQQAIESNQDAIKLICQPCDNIIDFAEHPQSIAIMVGPEGGLTSDEIDLAEKLQFNKVSLGETILRTETAATSAISVINYILAKQPG